MIDSYTLQLAREYLRLVDDMRSGGYSSAEIHQMDSDRQWTHNELLRITGLEPNEDMYAHCRRLLHLARGSNLQ